MERLDEVTVSLHEVEGPSRNQLNVPRLLIALGMAKSGGEALRALAERAVTLDNKASSIVVKLPTIPARIVVRVREHTKVAVLIAKPESQGVAERSRSFPPVRNRAFSS